MHARFYAPNLNLGESSVALPPEEAEHLSRVLRLGAGDEVRVFDGRGLECEGHVESVGRGTAVIALRAEVAAAGSEPPVEFVLGQALLKGDAMDTVVRDAVMMGVARIVPVETERCEMPSGRVRAAGRVARWQRIAVASVKQCGRAVVPDVTEPVTLAECLRGQRSESRFILAEPALGCATPTPPASLLSRLLTPADRTAEPPPAPTRPSVLLLAGPEGGWTAAELSAACAAGCQRVTLGPRTLRADAAAIVGLTVLQCLFGDFAGALGGA